MSENRIDDTLAVSLVGLFGPTLVEGMDDTARRSFCLGAMLALSTGRPDGICLSAELVEPPRHPNLKNAVLVPFSLLWSTLMAAADAPKKERLPAAERRQKIVDSARELFIAQGFSGARTKDIAEGAGVTEAFLYRYFESKEEMYSVSVLDPLRQGFEALADDIQVLFDTHSDPVEFILALNLRCLSFYSEFAALQTAALYSEPTNGRVFYTSTLEPILDRIGGLIAKRVGWEAQGLDVKIVRQAVLGSLWAIGVDFMLRPGSKNIDEVAVRLTRLFTSGVRERSLSA